MCDAWASIPKVVGSIPTVARHIFQACPVWIYIQSNITQDPMMLRPTLLTQLHKQLHVQDQWRYISKRLLKIELEKSIGSGEDEHPITQTVYFTSKPETIINEGQITTTLETTAAQIKTRVENWICNGSKWRVKRVLQHTFITKYKPLLACCNDCKKSLFRLVIQKVTVNQTFRIKAITNASDGVISFISQMKTDAGRIKRSDREFAKKLDCSGVTFPCSLS